MSATISIQIHAKQDAAIEDRTIDGQIVYWALMAK
jgi:hypothetical protein